MSALAISLKKASHSRYYDNEDIVRLQIVFNQACLRLGLPQTTMEREMLAQLIFQLADNPREVGTLCHQVVCLFREEATKAKRPQLEESRIQLSENSSSLEDVKIAANFS